MRREDLFLAGAALALSVLSFALVRGLRRIAGAHPEAAATLEATMEESAATLQPTPGIELAAEVARGAPLVDSAVLPAAAARAHDAVQGIVWGYLLGPDGRPDGQAALAFSDASGTQRGAMPDDRGAYSVAGLAPGTWWVSAGGIRLRSVEQTFEILPEPAPIRRDFVLEARPRIDVDLRGPDGRPFHEVTKELGLTVAGLLPVATREPPGERFYEVSGSPNNPFGVGEFWHRDQGGMSLPEGFLGSVLLEVDPPVHLSLVMQHLVLETRRIETTPASVTFVLDPAALAVRRSALDLRVVSAATGDPISGANAVLDESQEGPLTATDAAGELAWSALLPGRNVLRVDAAGFATHRARIELEPGLTARVDVALEPEVRISGTVSGPDGEPLVAEFWISRLRDDGTLDPDDGGHGSSDPTGRFELRGLSAGRHVLQAYAQRSSPRYYLPHADFLSENVVVDTRGGSVQELAIHLPRPARVAVRWAGGAREELFLRFLDERGLPRQYGRFHTAAPQTFTLPPGRWRLEVSDAERRIVAAEEFTLTSETLQLVLGESVR